ncbi:MAG TPA: carbohydrate ABC transporter permease [Thermomicrobiales bacterium]|nr:carbohydrate ABC transporter permease [Thermomicrobiales bacterium]
MLTTRPELRRMNWSLGKLVVVAILAVTTMISLFPLFWMLSTAFTPASSTIKTPPSLIPLPESLADPTSVPTWVAERAYVPTIENFQRLIRQTQGLVWRWLLNSAIIAVSITVFHVLFDSMAGYAFARKQFPGRNVLFWLLLSTLMIPAQVTLIPNFLLISRMGLADSHLGVILPGLADVFGIFLMRQYMQTLPKELEEAGRLDGAGDWQVFWQIVLPLAKPAAATLAIFMFMRSWNNFIWPLIVLRDGAKYTLPVGVATLQGEFSTDVGLIMAGAAVAAVPMIAFFLLFQRYFLQGIRIGALKG